MARRAQLLGAKELVATFARLSDLVATQYVEESLQAGAEVIDQSILSRIWVRTGRLKSLVHVDNVSVSRTRIVKTLTIGAQGFYWRFLEFGTHWRRGAHKGQLAPASQKLKPIPRLRQAIKSRRPTATQTIRDTFRDRVLGFEE